MLCNCYCSFDLNFGRGASTGWPRQWGCDAVFPLWSFSSSSWLSITALSSFKIHLSNWSRNVGHIYVLSCWYIIMLTGTVWYSGGHVIQAFNVNETGISSSSSTSVFGSSTSVVSDSSVDWYAGVKNHPMLVMSILFPTATLFKFEWVFYLLCKSQTNSSFPLPTVVPLFMKLLIVFLMIGIRIKISFMVFLQVGCSKIFENGFHAVQQVSIWLSGQKISCEGWVYVQCFLLDHGKHVVVPSNIPSKICSPIRLNQLAIMGLPVSDKPTPLGQGD